MTSEIWYNALVRLSQLWDRVWVEDRYASPKLREQKARWKLEVFESLGWRSSEHRNCADLGCGGGFVVAELIARGITQVTGFDHSPLALDNARRLVPSATFLELDLSISTEVESKFACLTAFNVLEHVPNPQVAIDNARRMLLEGGQALVTWSNKKSIFVFERRLRSKRSPWPYGIQHERTVEEVKEDLASAGLIVKFTSVRPCPGGNGLLSFIDRVMSVVPGFGRYIFVICEAGR